MQRPVTDYLERYTHADGTSTIIREYRADGSYHIMSVRDEIEIIDDASGRVVSRVIAPK